MELLLLGDDSRAYALATSIWLVCTSSGFWRMSTCRTNRSSHPKYDLEKNSVANED